MDFEKKIYFDMPPVAHLHGERTVTNNEILYKSRIFSTINDAINKPAEHGESNELRLSAIKI